MSPSKDPPTEFPVLDESWFTDEFLETWRELRARSERDSSDAGGSSRRVASTRFLREVHPGVFVVRMLRPESCRRLLAVIEARRERALAMGASPTPPNSMHDHGFVLDALGLGGCLADLRARWLAPITAACFPDFGGAHLDRHHAYVVEYARDRDEELGFHADDSEVTLNLCLGDEFQGAELTMLGLRCDLHRQSPVRAGEVFEIVHEPGVAVLHAGRHRHRVEPLRRGSRRNLIVWCRDTSRRAAPGTEARSAGCAPWCGDWRG